MVKMLALYMVSRMMGRTFSFLYLYFITVFLMNQILRMPCRTAAQCQIMACCKNQKWRDDESRFR